ncbi:MAG: TolC family protein [Spirochaetaceae bacterium]|jgi:outer membrane protein TolC|nr:TolC family protein [Spirochaetaceae bacterium]
MNSIKYILPLFFVTLCQFMVGAQTFNSLEDICNYALENSSEYKKTILDVIVARNNLEGVLKLNETTFTFSGDSSGSDNLSDSGDGADWVSSAAVELPLFDQLSMNASMDDDFNGSLGLNFTPLFHSDDRGQFNIKYEKALLLAEETAVQTENDALRAVLNWMSSQQQLAIQKEIVVLKEIIYRDQKIRYEAGESTFDALREDLLDWTEARSELSNQQTTLQASESLVLQKLGANLNLDAMEFFSGDIISAELEDMKEHIIPELSDSSQVYSVESSYLTVESNQQKLSDTRIFDPDLNLSVNMNLPDLSDSQSSSSLHWQAGIELVFSLNDWQSDDPSEYQLELNQSKLEAQQAEMESKLTLQQVLIALKNTEQNRLVAELEEEQSSDLYEEAKFLNQLGEYSDAELEDSRLFYEQSRVNSFSMLVNEYMAWRDLLIYL